MHEQFANAFYGSGAWKRCRREFAKARGNMCERCYRKGLVVVGTRERPLEVHHKIRLTPENIGDPDITLNWDNMELLCRAVSRGNHAELGQHGAALPGLPRETARQRPDALGRG